MHAVQRRHKNGDFQENMARLLKITFWFILMYCRRLFQLIKFISFRHLHQFIENNHIKIRIWTDIIDKKCIIISGNKEKIDYFLFKYLIVCKSNYRDFFNEWIIKMWINIHLVTNKLYKVSNPKTIQVKKSTSFSIRFPGDPFVSTTFCDYLTLQNTTLCHST